jgi:hypothetical protein
MLVTFIFNRPSRDYEQLLLVWKRSAQKYMPNVPREVVHLNPPPIDYRLSDITHAFIAATDYAIAAKENIIITDVDVMFRGDMTTLFEKDFDVAITERKWIRPLSSGVWYCKNTPEAKEFIQLWKSETLRLDALLGNRTPEEKKMQKKYGGLDQASLASALEKNKSANILFVPCAIYNAEQSCWTHMHKNCKCVHIASKLRDRCLGIEKKTTNKKKKRFSKERREKAQRREEALRPLVAEWKSYL